MSNQLQLISDSRGVGTLPFSKSSGLFFAKDELMLHDVTGSQAEVAEVS